MIPLVVIAAAALFASELRVGAPCASAEEVERAIEARRGEPWEMSAARGIAAQIDIARAGAQRWSVVIAVRTPSGSGERRLEVESCTLAVRTAALIVALAIEDAERAAASAAAATAAVTSSTMTSSAAAAAPPVEHSPRWVLRAIDDEELEEEVELAWYTRAGASAAVGVLPAAHPAFFVSAGAALGRVRFEAGAAYDLSSREATREDARIGGKFDLFRARLGTCLDVFQPPPFTIGGCARAELGALRGRGFGVQDSSTAVRGVFALAFSAEATAVLRGPLRLYGALEGAALITRPSFSLNNVGVLHRPEVFAGRFSAGVELFW